MKLIFKFSIILFTTILLTTSCRKDINDESIVNINIPGPEIVDVIYGDLDVYITDIDGNSLRDVDVFVYDVKTTTDKFGVAQFDNIPLDANGTFVRALIPGYFFGSDKFFPNGTNNSIVIRMLPLNNGKEIDPTSASQVSIDGGGNIKFQQNSFVSNSGEEYNGTVTVYAKRINPEEALSHEVMPGNLIGLDDRGITVILESFSMVAVELRDKDDNELQLKAGSPATLTFAVDDNLKDVAPQFIPTWSFDEVGGNWIEEGSAELIDGNYVAEVSHFSFWNCDAPFPLINVTGTVVDQSGNPQVGFYVLVKVNGMCGAGYTNGDGEFSGKMPKNQQLTFCVFAPGCDEPVYTTTLGPFTENTVLDPFVIESSTAVYSGIVLCEGEPLPEAPVYLVFENITEKYFTDANGVFEIEVQEINCVTFPEGELFALNPDNGIQSEVIEVNSQNLANITFEVCVDCDIEPYITQETPNICGGINIVTINIDGSVTDYEYEWSNGSTTEVIEVSENGFYCVTITEPITECSLVVCEDVEVSQELGLELEYFEISCFENGGMFTNAFGGTQPYSYNWDGPSFIDNGNGFIEIFIEGDYSVTVTDVNGCTAEESAFVGSQIGTEFLPINTQNVEFPILCDDESIYLYIDCNWCPIDTASVIWFLPDGSSVTGGSLWASEVGTYTASTNNGLCDFIGSIDVLPGGEFEYEIINTFCEDSSYFQVFQIFDQDIVVSITHQFLYLDLIEDFPDNFSGLIDYTSQFGCDGTLEYELPYAEGIDITLTSPPTCDTCIDGYIEVDYNDFSCECELGDAFVVSTDNIFDQYGLEELPSGDYYLLVNDINGCLIYVQEFSL